MLFRLYYIISRNVSSNTRKIGHIKRSNMLHVKLTTVWNIARLKQSILNICIAPWTPWVIIMITAIIMKLIILISGWPKLTSATCLRCTNWSIVVDTVFIKCTIVSFKVKYKKKKYIYYFNSTNTWIMIHWLMKVCFMCINACKGWNDNWQHVI